MDIKKTQEPPQNPQTTSLFRLRLAGLLLLAKKRKKGGNEKATPSPNVSLAAVPLWAELKLSTVKGAGCGSDEEHGMRAAKDWL